MGIIMSYEIFDPSKELQKIVRKYIVLNSSEDIKNMFFLPNGGNFIIFNRGVEASSKLFGSDELYEIPKSYSFSLKTNRVNQIFLNSEDNDDMFPVILAELWPIGFYKLFNIDMSALDFKYQEIEKELIDKYFPKLYKNGETKDELNYLNSSLLELNNSQNN